MELWLLVGASLFGVSVGFLTGASKQSGTSRAIVLALLGTGALTGILALGKDIDSAGQFLTGFYGGFIPGLGVGLWYRKGKRGPELFRETIAGQPWTTSLT